MVKKTVYCNTITESDFNENKLDVYFFNLQPHSLETKDFILKGDQIWVWLELTNLGQISATSSILI